RGDGEGDARRSHGRGPLEHSHGPPRRGARGRSRRGVPAERRRELRHRAHLGGRRRPLGMSELEPSWTPLKPGADTVQMLLPHRRPFLLVDGTLAVALGPRPALRAFKNVSANEPVFDGHFPGLSLWPGVYTIEGLGQTTNLLDVTVALAQAFERHGAS